MPHLSAVAAAELPQLSRNSARPMTNSRTETMESDRQCPERAARWAVRNMVNNWYLSLTVGLCRQFASRHKQANAHPGSRSDFSQKSTWFHLLYRRSKNRWSSPCDAMLSSSPQHWHC